MRLLAPCLGKSDLNNTFNLSKIAVSFAMFLPLILCTTRPAQAQTYQVLHYFTYGADGARPIAGVTVAGSGTLYGTTPTAGTGAYGTAYKLTQHGSSWVFSPLYEFTEGIDGTEPEGGLVVGPSGVLYGTASGGGRGGSGTVFELQPPSTPCRTILCYWIETPLYSFLGGPSDGASPWYEDLVFDSSGNIYGTTRFGGTYEAGTAFQLTPSGGGWSETVLHSFGNGTDGSQPWSGLVLDSAGNLYGTTIYGADGCGTIYELSPSSGGWLESVLVNFGGDNGCEPIGGLFFDPSSGNLYGTTFEAGSGGAGTVFKLVPSNGGWTMTTIYSFAYGSCSPAAGVTIDSGNLYGTCFYGGSGLGSVFELTNCSQTCTLIDLHDFTGSDGQYPWGAVALDASGNIYGTTFYGGNTGGDCSSNGCGVVWQITP